jgi:hypothetical protein
MKRFFLIPLLLLSAGSMSAQNNWKTFAIELNAEISHDDADRTFNSAGGFKARYNTKQERISLGAVYNLAPCVRMKTALGISAYTSRLLLRPMPVPNYTQIMINQTSLVLQQKALYDLIRWRYRWAGVRISPFVGIAYEQFLNGDRGAKGFLDLENKKDLQDRFNSGLPCAVGGTSKLPAGILTASAGASVELTLSRFGIFYDFGYAYSTGHSQFDAQYVAAGGEPHALTVRSKGRGPSHALGVRCYF